MTTIHKSNVHRRRIDSKTCTSSTGWKKRSFVMFPLFFILALYVTSWCLPHTMFFVNAYLHKAFSYLIFSPTCGTSLMGVNAVWVEHISSNTWIALTNILYYMQLHSKSNWFKAASSGTYFLKARIIFFISIKTFCKYFVKLLYIDCIKIFFFKYYIVCYKRSLIY